MHKFIKHNAKQQTEVTQDSDLVLHNAKEVYIKVAN